MGDAEYRASCMYVLGVLVIHRTYIGTTSQCKLAQGFATLAVPVINNDTNFMQRLCGQNRSVLSTPLELSAALQPIPLRRGRCPSCWGSEAWNTFHLWFNCV